MLNKVTNVVLNCRTYTFPAMKIESSPDTVYSYVVDCSTTLNFGVLPLVEIVHMTL